MGHKFSVKGIYFSILILNYGLRFCHVSVDFFHV